jgi:integrase
VLILVLGLRRGEVLGLTWNDVDLDKAQVSSKQTLDALKRLSDSLDT